MDRHLSDEQKEVVKSWVMKDQRASQGNKEAILEAILADEGSADIFAYEIATGQKDGTIADAFMLAITQ